MKISFSGFCFPVVGFELVELRLGKLVKVILHFPDATWLKFFHRFLRYRVLVFGSPKKIIFKFVKKVPEVREKGRKQLYFYLWNTGLETGVENDPSSHLHPLKLTPKTRQRSV